MISTVRLSVGLEQTRWSIRTSVVMCNLARVVLPIFEPEFLVCVEIKYGWWLVHFLPFLRNLLFPFMIAGAYCVYPLLNRERTSSTPLGSWSTPKVERFVQPSAASTHCQHLYALLHERQWCNTCFMESSIFIVQKRRRRGRGTRTFCQVYASPLRNQVHVEVSLTCARVTTPKRTFRVALFQYQHDGKMSAQTGFCLCLTPLDVTEHWIMDWT